MEAAFYPKSFNRGWKAAPTEKTPVLKLMTLTTFPLKPHMKLHLTNAEVGMWNAEGWSRCALSLYLNKDGILFYDLAPLRFRVKLY
jgi:hypothetical protein